jgi:hypothetical protein
MSYPEPMPIFFGPQDRQQLAAALRVHEGPNQFRPGGRFPQRAEYGEPEPLRVTFLALHRYPRGECGQVRLDDPGSKQERLSALRVMGANHLPV